MWQDADVNPIHSLAFVFHALAAVSSLMVLLNAPSVSAQTPAREQAAATFIQAIEENDTNTIANMLVADTNLTRAFYYGRLPLHVAASKGRAEIVALLLRSGADINAPGDTLETSGKGLTALDAAIWYGHSNVCLQLLQAGADPNRLCRSDGSALHFAFTYKRKDMVGWLLEHGANPFLEGGNPYRKTTPFELAITSGAGEFVPVMLREARVKPGLPKSGAQMLKDGVRPPFKEPVARFLAARGPDLLSAAAQRAQLEAVEALLDAGIHANANAGEGFSVLQSVALAEAAASRAKDFSEARWNRIRELLEKNGATFDVFAATGWGDLAAARRLVSANSGAVHARDYEGATPLHWAVKTDRPPMTSFWLEAGVAPAATNFAGQTPLHLAAANGFGTQVKVLLAANAPATARDTNGFTPLDVATEAQHSEVIRLLLGQEPVGARPERGITQPIHKAAEAGNLAALAALVADKDKLEVRNELGFTPLAVALRGGHLAAAALLVDKGADVNTRSPEGDTLLQQVLAMRAFVNAPLPESWLGRAAKDPAKEKFLPYLKKPDDGDISEPIIQIAAFLLASGADVNATNRAGRTVIQLAADEEIMERAMFFDEGRATFLKLLSLAGGQLNALDANGDTPLHLAGRGTDADQVKALIAGGADINATNRLGRTPLHNFVEHIGGWDMNEDGDNQPFQCLLKQKPNVNAQDNDGLTPLHVLAQSDTSFKEEAARLLLAAGASPNLRDKHQRPPAHLFLVGEWPWRDAGECLALLAEHGADLSVVDDAGQTLLHYLAKSGNGSTLFFIRDITNLLASAKLDVSARDNRGDTPLHIAARSGASDVFGWLAARGASLDATNQLGETPRTLAARSQDLFTRFRFNADTDIFRAIQERKLDSVAVLVNADPSLANAASQFGQTPLRLAVTLRATNIVEFLEQHGARWDAASAVIAGRVEPLREILAHDRSAVTNTAMGKGLLHLAAVTGNAEIIQILISAGADMRAQDDWGLSPIGNARLRLQPAAVTELLRRHGAEENIFDAAFNRDAQLAATLLGGNRALALATNRNGASVVEVAAMTGPVELLKRLLDKGAKVDFVNPRTHQSLVHSAAQANQAGNVELLIRRGAKFKSVDSQGFTPLHLASLCGAADAATVLLKHKANPDARTAAPREDQFPPMRMMGPGGGTTLVGCTPLHLAAMFGQTNLISLLLKSGASINATNSVGATPTDLASGMRVPPAFFLLQRNLGPVSGPFGTQSWARTNVMAGLRERQGLAKQQLERAGGTHSTSPGTGFRPPGSY
jgi:ankyrin repeat protein